MEVEEDQIGSLYIQQISPKMFEIGSNDFRVRMHTDEFRLAKEDIRFVKVFLELCLERWDMTSDEQSREILTSMLIFFEVIWIEEHNKRPIIDRIKRPEEGEVEEDLQSLILELGGRIHQTKLLMEGWCLSLLPNSLMQLKCKSTSTIDEVQNFLRLVKDDLLPVLLRRRDARTVPFEYFGIFIINNIDFLIRLSDNLKYSTESKNCIDFLKFASAFSNKAACFTCLYWAKEVNVDEIATAIEMNILLFSMIHDFIPFAPDVIACYFRILHSTTEYLHSIYLREKYYFSY